MKNIIFITGVSGVGKTTVMKYLKSNLGVGFDIHDFDEAGVPENATRQWRIEQTNRWIEIGRQNAGKGIITIICGFARPSEIGNDQSVGFILLDADPQTIRSRLTNRYQTAESRERIERVAGKSVEQFIVDNMNFAQTMRDEAKSFGIDIIDTASLSPENIAQEVISKIGKIQ